MNLNEDNKIRWHNVLKNFIWHCLRMSMRYCNSSSTLSRCILPWARNSLNLLGRHRVNVVSRPDWTRQGRSIKLIHLDISNEPGCGCAWMHPIRRGSRRSISSIQIRVAASFQVVDRESRGSDGARPSTFAEYCTRHTPGSMNYAYFPRYECLSDGPAYSFDRL